MSSWTERDIRLAASLDDALAIVNETASALNSTFVLTEGAGDFRSGHIENGGRAILDIVLLDGSSATTIVRVDTRQGLGGELASLLAARPEAV
jgi:hypothetical protein